MEGKGDFVALAGHSLPKNSKPVQLGDHTGRGVTLTLSAANVLRDPEDHEVVMIAFPNGFPEGLDIEPAIPCLQPVKEGQHVFAVGFSSLGSFTSEGVVVGETTEEGILRQLHSLGAAEDEGEEAVSFLEDKPLMRLLATYSSHQMVSGASIFSKRDGTWGGVRSGGASFWRYGTAPPTYGNRFQLLQPARLRKSLLGAGTATRYSFFVPAMHFLKLLK